METEDKTTQTTPKSGKTIKFTAEQHELLKNMADLALRGAYRDALTLSNSVEGMQKVRTMMDFAELVK